MKRTPVAPRAHWQQRVAAHGFDFHSLPTDDSATPAPYWIEDACYEFTPDQIDIVEAATQALHDMCLDAVSDIIRAGDYRDFDLTQDATTLIERSFERNERGLYGRMDLRWDGSAPPKLLEYNADTPTSLLESSVVQWFWLADRNDDTFDQFNSIHERLIAAWPRVLGAAETLIHFVCHQDSREDFGTTEYLRDTCIQAGHATTTLDIAEIGHDGAQFVDAADQVIERMFKLYPWEWLFAEEFGTHLVGARTRWIEPPWKRLLADKAFLVHLWRRHPGHPNLLPTSFDRADIPGEAVFKPCLEREGRGVHFLPAGTSSMARVRGIHQASCRLPVFGPWHTLVGSWIIGDEACGIGIREDSDAITRNTSRFVPHRFR